MRMTTCVACGRLVSPGPRCPDCARRYRRTYDESRPLHHKVYATAAWRRISRAVRENAVRCHWCLRPLTFETAVADHVVPVWQAPDRALDPDGIVAACVGCNTRRGRHARQPVTYRQPTFDEAIAREKRR